jgi:diphthamide synthase subunit DPH2
MAVTKIFTDEINNHSIECFVNTQDLCYIGCKQIGTDDVYSQQFVTLDLHTLTEFINELHLVRQEMEAIQNG